MKWVPKKVVSDKGNVSSSHKVKPYEYKKLTTFNYQAIVMKNIVFSQGTHVDMLIFKINFMVINYLCRKSMR